MCSRTAPRSGSRKGLAYTQSAPARLVVGGGDRGEWVCGCVGGCVGVWVCGCVCVWVCGCVGV